MQAMHLIRIGKYNFLESDKVITVLISNPWQRFLRTVRSGSSCSMLLMSVGDCSQLLTKHDGVRAEMGASEH